MPAPHAAVRLALGAAGRAVPRGYLGLSIEFQAIRAYTGTDPAAINPVLESLIRNLSPGQPPVLRIGGDSSDVAWVPAPGVARPPFQGYELTPGWMATTAALAHAVGARMILGLNLAAGDPALSAAEAGAYLRAFGRRSIAAMEIGNEPNLYAAVRQFTSRAGRSVTSRPRTYTYRDYQAEFAATAAALPMTDPAMALLGPALSAGPQPTGPWPPSMGAFLRDDRSVSALSVHRYPLRNCDVGPSSPQYPTIAHLLSDYATVALAAGVGRWVRVAHDNGRAVRIDELNSVACRGAAGVSDTFASSLWATDALFSLVAAGVDGVNLHTLPGAAYQLFQFSHRDGRWRGAVAPAYYGLLLFAQAAPVGSRLLGVHGAPHSTRLSAWATRASDHTARLVLIDKAPGHPETVEVPAPAGAHGPVSVERMRAPSVRATGHVTLGGRGYGRETDSGTLRAPILQAPGRAPNGDYVVTVPGGSAALVTFGAS